MQIDMLYFDGCPSWQVGLENLQAALSAEGIEAGIRLVQVDDDERAARLRFLGSPSFHVEGRELWPEEREYYALSCRVYSTPLGMKGAPTVEMLSEKLRAVGEKK
jgi:hypothetical protein